VMNINNHLIIFYFSLLEILHNSKNNENQVSKNFFFKTKTLLK